MNYGKDRVRLLQLPISREFISIPRLNTRERRVCSTKYVREILRSQTDRQTDCRKVLQKWTTFFSSPRHDEIHRPFGINRIRVSRNAARPQEASEDPFGSGSLGNPLKPRDLADSISTPTCLPSTRDLARVFLFLTVAPRAPCLSLSLSFSLSVDQAVPPTCLNIPLWRRV